MFEVKESDVGLMMTRGRHFHFTRGMDWFTTLPGGETVEGFVADPEFVEPKVLLDDHGAPDGVKRRLFQFKVMHCGWECDEDGWVVEMDDGSRAIVLSSHNALYVAEPSELQAKLAEYEKVARDTALALKMVSDSDTHRQAETENTGSVQSMGSAGRNGIAQGPSQ